jgi:hypothetical protein
MPSSLFEHHDDVPVGRDGGSELGQKHVHGRGRDMRDDERESVSRGGSHRVLEIGRGEALVAEAKGALAAHQSMADASVAPHLCLVLEPKLEFGTGIGGTSALYSRDEPLFANASAAPASRLGCPGRAFCRDRPRRGTTRDMDFGHIVFAEPHLDAAAKIRQRPASRPADLGIRVLQDVRYKRRLLR